MAKQFDPLVSCRYGKAVINKYLFDSKFEPECRTYQVTKNSVFVIQKEYFEFPYLDSDYYYTADMFIRDIKKKKHNNPICLGMYRNGLEMAKAFECAKQNMDKIRFFNTHNGVIVTGEYIYRIF
ncbi:MAG: hypothetical protein J6L91_04990 [Clostridia bacterium]|nr:hypothetical protein [Clostridia bacterium]